MNINWKYKRGMFFHFFVDIHIYFFEAAFLFNYIYVYVHMYFFLSFIFLGGSGRCSKIGEREGRTKK